MRFDLAGRSLWYNTPDAPAPEGAVAAGAVAAADGVTVTVGVQPLNASNRVEVHYRVNGGPPVKIPAVLFRTDVQRGAQYFSARLPHLRVGDRVDYGPLCTCGTAQLPQPGPPHFFPSSFHVAGPGSPQPSHAAQQHPPAAGRHDTHPGARQAGAAAGHHPATAPPPHASGSPGHGGHVVEGIISSPGRGPLAGVLVEIVDKNPGPHASLATAKTDESGHYRASYTPPAKKAKPDICARVFFGQTLLAVSAVRYNAGEHESLGVTVPANAEGLPSEYDTLTEAIGRVHAGKLADLQESGERDDITYLARKTGWDARAIVFAAVAEKLARARANGALQPAFYYALFRAGFSTDADALYVAQAATVSETWRQAIQRGIISTTLNGSVDAATKSFQSLCATHALEAKPAIGLSTLKELLQVTLGADAHRQQTFADLHIRHQDDPGAFWIEIEKAFGSELTKRLELDGALAHLTLNNAPLMVAVHRAQAKPPLNAVGDLAWRGYYEAAKWTPLIGVAIPKEIVGDTVEHRRTRYAEYLAAQVRLASPLAVVADMVANGTLTLSPHATAADKAGMHAFFLEHDGRFSLGGEPVERYLARNLSAVYPPSVIAEIKRLQRVYQITPNDQAFAALLRHGLDSAYAVTRYDPAGFARAFGHDLGGAGVANQVHAKARVVAAAALQIATSRLAARGPHAGAAALRPAENGQIPDGHLITSPTMEQLFGSMDFCDCPECRSILSPAAYLVDLLNFIDYPPAGKKNPQTVLFERRPDLQYLPLTCENTNTVLPYVDLVNETLEYFVAHRMSLEDFRGHTTDGHIASEELLASPQFVQESAYTILKNAFFPVGLPFDRSLELLRLHFEAMGVPLHSAMAALHVRKSGHPNAADYGWNDILMERVGLSRTEYRLLTDGSLTLEEIYGFGSPGRATAHRPESPSHEPSGAPTQIAQEAAGRHSSLAASHASVTTSSLSPSPVASGVPTAAASPNPSSGGSPVAAGAPRIAATTVNLNPPPPASGGSTVTTNPHPSPGESHAVAVMADHSPSSAASRAPAAKPALAQPAPAASATLAGAHASSELQLRPNLGRDGATAAAELANFQFYCRRVGLSYEDMSAIVRTRFINPSTGIAARVAALGVSFEVIQALKSGMIADAEFIDLLPAGLDPVAYGAHPAAHKRDYGPIIAWVKDEANYSRIMGLLIIAKAEDSDDVCSAAVLRLRYANPDPVRRELRAVDFVRLLRFIRVWRKLRLSIDQTDAVITALYPARDNPDEAVDLTRLDAQFTTLLARIGALLQVMDLLSLSPEHDVAALLACWAPIGADGRRSLYARMFLSASLLREDPVFAEDPKGNVLQGAARLLDHEPALRSALRLTGAEFAAVAAALGFTAATPLNLDNVSAIYRRGWLARTLRLSVVELLALTQCTGMDPFAPLDVEKAATSAAPSDAAPPDRAPPMIRFVRLVQALRDAGVTPAQAIYLLWNLDISGKSAPTEKVVFGLAQSLRANAAAIETQFALVDDPTGSIAKNLMGLVYASDTTEFFFSLLDGSLTVSAPYAGSQATLPDAVISASQNRLTYDDLRKQLTYTGVLDDHTLSALTSAPEVDDPLRAALAALAKANHRAVDPFFASYPKLEPIYATYAASADPEPVKRKALLAAILPDLKEQKKREQALASVTAAAGADPSFAATLLRNAEVLAAAANAGTPALEDFTALAFPGLAAQFFSNNDPSGSPDTTVDAVATLAYAPNSATTLPAASGGPIAAIWSGLVETSKSGPYDIAVTTDAGASVSIEIDGKSVTMALGNDGWSNQTAISLQAGLVVPFVLKATGLKSVFSVRWTTTGVPWQVIPSSCLYSAAVLDRLRTSYTRFLKATSLATALSLTANEIAYLAANPDLRVGGQGWLKRLMAAGLPDAASGAALTDVLKAVLDFACMKAALSPADESLLGVLRNPDAALSGGANALLALTQWDQASLTALLIHFFGDGKTGPLVRLENFRRVYDAYATVTACRISAAALIKSTTNSPTSAEASVLQSALRAQYADGDWLTLVKPINDKMRARQRDALVAFTLHHLKERPATRSIDTPDRLFEYLLMDVEMASCGQTSRIRLALSSIQLFIERALRSLEPDVDPSHISPEQWEWMKRYRIWQANREVFLWPENWLDPELRDNQSPSFKETMGELLQGDITEDAAASALLGYLAKLNEVAKLEPCGMHHVASTAGAADAVTHVIARTAGSKRKYYYRRQELGGWTAWEETKLGIEDNPVVPIIWNDRLILLWVQILKQTPPTDNSSDDSDSPPPKPKELKLEDFFRWSKRDWAEWRASVERYDAYQRAHESSPSSKKLTDANFADLHQAAKSSAGEPNVTVQALLCFSEYHDGKWLPANTSDVNTPTLLGSYAPHGPEAFDRSRLRLRATVLPEGHLMAHLAVDDKLDEPGAGFLLYNTHSVPIELGGVPAEMLHGQSNQRLASYASSTLRIDYKGAATFTRDILHTRIGGSVVESQPGLPDAWEAPFLYEDSRNVFFVKTEELAEPPTAPKRFVLSHPSGVGHAGTAQHFPPIVTAHQSGFEHVHASMGPAVRYEGALINAAGRVGSAPSHTGRRR